MKINKIEAKKATCEAQAKRVLREQVQAQKVRAEQQAQVPQPTSPKQIPASFPSFKVEDSADEPKSARGCHNNISQDDDSPPSSNTRQQRHLHMLTQDYMLQMIETPGYTAPFTPAQASCCKYPLQFLCDFAYAVLNDDTGDIVEYRHLIKHPKQKDIWSQSFGKQIRCLATTTKTIFFRNKQEIPKDRQGDVTYNRIVCVYQDSKKDKYHTRITMGGNLINYPGDCGTPTADLLTVKLLLNSIIFTSTAKFMSIDIKDFYLNTPMSRYKYF